MDYGLPGFSLHGILQARILKWVAISFSKSKEGILYLFCLYTWGNQYKKIINNVYSLEKILNVKIKNQWNIKFKKSTIKEWGQKIR